MVITWIKGKFSLRFFFQISCLAFDLLAVSLYCVPCLWPHETVICTLHHTNAVFYKLRYGELLFSLFLRVTWCFVLILQKDLNEKFAWSKNLKMFICCAFGLMFVLQKCAMLNNDSMLFLECVLFLLVTLKWFYLKDFWKKNQGWIITVKFESLAYLCCFCRTSRVCWGSFISVFY